MRSWETEAEITSKRPAAVDNAAASAPAATKAITQGGSSAISGLAKTMMSRSIYTSLLDFTWESFEIILSPNLPMESSYLGLTGSKAFPVAC